MTERLVGLPVSSPLLTIAMVILVAALLLALVRIVRGPTIPDRVIALDLTASLVVGLLLLLGAVLQLLAIVDIAIVLALIAFLGTVAFASLIERRTRE
ncbi:monovalent cation/H+ antiporter complex subunit F [Thermomicrobium sp. CFH 73360]|uniref:pH regulation protein F n=1 Tax=Thermomicrobium roseum TaxID=500 RepID=A0A7C5VVX0_THERO|nr:monovalent cation/H+ antiporter complex subunit F [Thermomicrobium sp. CFH 73360]MCM8746899.1 monovalent cation/H+ antiporter complex subunit F [Thermomicrobium sp. CFH 73360]